MLIMALIIYDSLADFTETINEAMLIDFNEARGIDKLITFPDKTMVLAYVQNDGESEFQPYVKFFE